MSGTDRNDPSFMPCLPQASQAQEAENIACKGSSAFPERRHAILGNGSAVYLTLTREGVLSDRSEFSEEALHGRLSCWHTPRAVLPEWLQ